MVQFLKQTGLPALEQTDTHRQRTDLGLLGCSGCSSLLCHTLLDLRDLVSVVGMVGVVWLQEVELCVPGLVYSNTVLKLQSCQPHAHTLTLSLSNTTDLFLFSISLSLTLQNYILPVKNLSCYQSTHVHPSVEKYGPVQNA